VLLHISTPKAPSKREIATTLGRDDYGLSIRDTQFARPKYRRQNYLMSKDQPTNPWSSFCCYAPWLHVIIVRASEVPSYTFRFQPVVRSTDIWPSSSSHGNPPPSSRASLGKRRKVILPRAWARCLHHPATSK